MPVLHLKYDVSFTSFCRKNILAFGRQNVRYHAPEEWIVNYVISDISSELRETTLTISDSIVGLMTWCL